MIGWYIIATILTLVVVAMFICGVVDFLHATDITEIETKTKREKERK